MTELFTGFERVTKLATIYYAFVRAYICAYIILLKNIISYFFIFTVSSSNFGDKCVKKKVTKKERSSCKNGFIAHLFFIHVVSLLSNDQEWLDTLAKEHVVHDLLVQMPPTHVRE